MESISREIIFDGYDGIFFLKLNNSIKVELLYKIFKNKLKKLLN